MKRLMLNLFARAVLGLSICPVGALAQGPEADSPVSDPTRAGPDLRAALQGLTRPAKRVPGGARLTLPKLALVARLKLAGRAPAALLQVGDRFHPVSEGSRLSYSQPDGEVLLFEVTGLSDQALQLRVQPYGQALTLR